MNQPIKEEEKMNQQKEETTDQESLLRPKAGALSVLSIEKESIRLSLLAHISRPTPL
jgi:hypothetical protein